MTRFALILLALLLPAQAGLAAEEPAKDSHRTAAGLYVTAAEAARMLAGNPDTILIDVRDPVEAMFTGFATPTKVHVPLKLVDRGNFRAERGSFAMPDNPGFAAEVEARLAALGADKAKTRLVFMCRSGSRSSKAADALHARGWALTYSMIDGFQGDKQSGNGPPARTVNGWQNSGLPWTDTLPEDIVYIDAE